MKIKVYELITASEENGTRSVITKLFSDKEELANDFNSLVEKTIGKLEKTYGEDSVADQFGAFEDLLDFDSIPVRYVWNKKDICFWAKDMRNPESYNIYVWTVEHEI